MGSIIGRRPAELLPGVQSHRVRRTWLVATRPRRAGPNRAQVLWTWTRTGTEWSGECVSRASAEDFAAYVGLRWQSLVRTLVLLDCTPDRAEQVALSALSRVHRSWARVRRSDDVGPPPLDAIVAGSGHNGVSGRVLVAVAMVLVFVAAGAAVLLHDSAAPSATPSAAPSKPPRVATANVLYRAEGRLHVGGLTVPARAVTDLVDPGVGAVHRTSEADIVLVDDRGGTAEIGHSAMTGMVADRERGWVFWLTYTQQLVVYDAREGHSVAQRADRDPLATFRNSRALALDDGIAYYDTPRGVRAWHVDPDRVTRTAPRNPAFLARGGDLVVTPTRDFLGIVMTRAGKPLWRRDALLAPRVDISRDGARVLVLSASASPILLEARTGVELPTGLPSSARVITVAFTRDGAAAYVVDRHGKTSALVECRGTPPSCTTVATATGGLAVAR